MTQNKGIMAELSEHLSESLAAYQFACKALEHDASAMAQTMARFRSGENPPEEAKRFCEKCKNQLNGTRELWVDALVVFLETVKSERLDLETVMNAGGVSEIARYDRIYKQAVTTLSGFSREYL